VTGLAIHAWPRTRGSPLTRLLTYNVHRCVGTDAKLDVGRVAEVIAAQSPDIVCLQEVDVGRVRTGCVDQAERLAHRLGMAFHFNAALRVEAELYGDAILTALPVRLVKSGPLPGYRRLTRLEPRGALWVAVTIDGVEVQIVNTHLGLIPTEQRGQAKALLGPDWLGGWSEGPVVLVGDFNAPPVSQVYRILSAALRDARRAAPFARAVPTFPSPMPVLALDHIFVSPGLAVKNVRTPLDALSRKASDHLPLTVDFSLV
jgi:endonuclease/exonuclease/phosphatase family metal-dependent hydrolase